MGTGREFKTSKAGPYDYGWDKIKDFLLRSITPGAIVPVFMATPDQDPNKPFFFLEKADESLWQPLDCLKACGNGIKVPNGVCPQLRDEQVCDDWIKDWDSFKSAVTKVKEYGLDGPFKIKKDQDKAQMKKWRTEARSKSVKGVAIKQATAACVSVKEQPNVLTCQPAVAMQMGERKRDAKAKCKKMIKGSTKQTGK